MTLQAGNVENSSGIIGSILRFDSKMGRKKY